MSKTARNNNSIPVKEAFESFLKAYNLKNKFNESYLVTYWEQIMGSSIASRTENIEIRNGILYLRINSAPLRHELILAKSKLIDVLNKEIGQEIIKDVMIH